MYVCIGRENERGLIFQSLATKNYFVIYFLKRKREREGERERERARNVHRFLFSFFLSLFFTQSFPKWERENKGFTALIDLGKAS